MKRDPVYTCYKIANMFYEKKITLVSVIIRAFMRIIFACDVPYQTKIGKGTLFPHHALGVIIHPYAKIGENCVINQNVTIGGRSGYKQLPVIGDNTLLGAGSIILGPIKIGCNVKVGAGTVITKDIPDNAVVIGSKARIIKFDNDSGTARKEGEL